MSEPSGTPRTDAARYRKATLPECLRIIAARLSDVLSPAEKRELAEAAQALSRAEWVPLRVATQAMLDAGYAAAAFPRDPEICAAMWTAMYDAAAPTAAGPADPECLTCRGDPAVCATVPGLRHCERANREPAAPKGGRRG